MGVILQRAKLLPDGRRGLEGLDHQGFVQVLFNGKRWGLMLLVDQERAVVGVPSHGGGGFVATMGATDCLEVGLGCC